MATSSRAANKFHLDVPTTTVLKEKPELPVQQWFDNRRRKHCPSLDQAKQCTVCAELYRCAAMQRKKFPGRTPAEKTSSQKKASNPSSFGPTDPIGHEAQAGADPILLIHVNGMLSHRIRRGGSFHESIATPHAIHCKDVRPITLNATF